MKTTIEWLDAAKQQHGLSDYALAPLLGISRSQMSNYRNGRDYLSDDAALKLAALLDMENPAPIIASAHAERSKTAEARGFWERMAAVAAGVLVAVGVSTAPAPTQAATTGAQMVSDCILCSIQKAPEEPTDAPELPRPEPPKSGS